MARYLRFLLCLCAAAALTQGGAAWGTTLAPLPNPTSWSVVAPALHTPDASTLDLLDDEVGGSLDRQLAFSSATVGLPGIELQSPLHASLPGLGPCIGYRIIPRHILFQSRLI